MLFLLFAMFSLNMFDLNGLTDSWGEREYPMANEFEVVIISICNIIGCASQRCVFDHNFEWIIIVESEDLLTDRKSSWIFFH